MNSEIGFGNRIRKSDSKIESDAEEGFVEFDDGVNERGALFFERGELVLLGIDGFSEFVDLGIGFGCHAAGVVDVADAGDFGGEKRNRSENGHQKEKAAYARRLDAHDQEVN